MMVADRIKNENQYHVAVIGDGAMTAGMAFEALNHAGHIDDNILVILNDNNMSISTMLEDYRVTLQECGE